LAFVCDTGLGSFGGRSSLLVLLFGLLDELSVVGISPGQCSFVPDAFFNQPVELNPYPQRAGDKHAFAGAGVVDEYPAPELLDSQGFLKTTD